MQSFHGSELLPDCLRLPHSWLRPDTHVRSGFCPSVCKARVPFRWRSSNAQKAKRSCRTEAALSITPRLLIPLDKSTRSTDADPVTRTGPSGTCGGLLRRSGDRYLFAEQWFVCFLLWLGPFSGSRPFCVPAHSGWSQKFCEPCFVCDELLPPSDPGCGNSLLNSRNPAVIAENPRFRTLNARPITFHVR